MCPEAHTISNGALTARVTNYGASLMDLRLDGVAQSLVLGYPDTKNYVSDPHYMGAVIGRYANRISNGSVPWHAGSLTLEKNEGGINHLHGGSRGFGQVIWTVQSISENNIVFAHSSPSGEGGYPGDLAVTASYQIITPATLRLTLCATTTKTTIINLCHHPYFNLDGTDDISGHVLQIYADRFVEADAKLIPTGDIVPTAGTKHEFEEPQSLDELVLFNTTFCLHHENTGRLREAARLHAEDVVLTLHTTQPGLHFYDGYKLRSSARGHGRLVYGPRAGLCLEAQAWPDSPNHDHFPSVLLHPGEHYEQTTDYCFARSGT